MFECFFVLFEYARCACVETVGFIVRRLRAQGRTLAQMAVRTTERHWLPSNDDGLLASREVTVKRATSQQWCKFQKKRSVYLLVVDYNRD